MKYLISILMAGMMMYAPTAEAELNGRKVVFVHGFQLEDLSRLRSENVIKEEGLNQAGAFMKPYMDDSIYYHSGYRLSDNSQRLYDQVKRIEQAGTCAQGCYFVTASTGDLVTRYIMSRLNQWGIDKNRFKIALTFDMVGAGGGTEGADEIISALNGNFLGLDLNRYLFRPLFGFDLQLGAYGGIVNDLRPSIARRTAMEANIVPRIRIAAGKQMPVISSLLLGGDDGIVPLHSACGSSRQEAIYSCSRSIDIDGRIRSASGPSSFMYNHFPIMMAKELRHTEPGAVKPSGPLVALNDGRTFGDFNYDVSERNYSTGWWIFKKHYRVINKDDNMSLPEFFIREFN